MSQLGWDTVPVCWGPAHGPVPQWSSECFCSEPNPWRGSVLEQMDLREAICRIERLVEWRFWVEEQAKPAHGLESQRSPEEF